MRFHFTNSSSKITDLREFDLRQSQSNKLLTLLNRTKAIALVFLSENILTD